MTLLPARHQWAVLALLATAFFMTILDGTITMTALPTLQRALGLGVAATQWTVAAYALAFSGLLLLSGRTADLFGRRRIFLAGIALRILASLLAGFAPTGEVLIIARAVQGVGAAIIAPAALSLVMSTFPEGAKRNKALGIWGGLGGIGATAGLLLGGIITDSLGWPWIFWVNVPIGAIVLVLAPRLLPQTRDQDTAAVLDLPGAVTISAALVLLIAGVNAVADKGWTSPHTIGLFIADAALITAFILLESRAAAPLLPLPTLRSRSLVGGNLLILTAGMAVDAMLITLTGYVQQVLGWAAVQFGLVASVMTFTSVIGALVSQRAITRRGLRPVAATGTILIVVAGLLLTRVTSSSRSLGVILTALLVFGVGLSAVFVSAQISALSSIAANESGLAAGLIDTSFAIGSALGVAIGIRVAAAHVATTNTAGVQALVDGQKAAFAVVAVFGVLGLLVVLTLLRPTPTVGAHRAVTARNTLVVQETASASDSGRGVRIRAAAPTPWWKPHRQEPTATDRHAPPQDNNDPSARNRGIT